MKKLLFLFILFIPLFALAAEIDSEKQHELETLKIKIQIHNYLRNLDLTFEQLQQIYSIAITFDHKRSDFEKQYNKVEEETKRAFLKLKKELIQGEPSKEVGGKASHLEHKIKDMKQDFEKIIQYHQHEIVSILSPQQQKKALQENPPLMPEPKNKRNQKKGKGKRNLKEKEKDEGSFSSEDLRIQRAMEELRNMPEEKYGKIEGKIIEARLRYMKGKVGQGLTEKEEEAEKTRFQKFLKNLRTLNADDFKAKQGELTRHFKYQGLDEMEKELAELQAKWHGQKHLKNNIGKFLLHKEALAILKSMVEEN